MHCGWWSHRHVGHTAHKPLRVTDCAECLSTLAISLALVAATIVNWCTLLQALPTNERKHHRRQTSESTIADKRAKAPSPTVTISVNQPLGTVKAFFYLLACLDTHLVRKHGSSWLRVVHDYVFASFPIDEICVIISVFWVVSFSLRTKSAPTSRTAAQFLFSFKATKWITNSVLFWITWPCQSLTPVSYLLDLWWMDSTK